MTEQNRFSWAIVATASVALYAVFQLNEAINIWISLSAVGAALIVVVIGMYRDRLPVWFALRSGDLGRRVGIGVVAGGLMCAATYGGFAVISKLWPDVAQTVDGLYAQVNEPPGPVRALPVMLLVILAEELVWRGVLFDGLRRLEEPEWLEREGEDLFHSWWAVGAVVLSAAAYALPQIGHDSMLVVAVAFVCGLIWGGLRAWTGGLVAALVAHLVWDLAVFVFYPVT